MSEAVDVLIHIRKIIHRHSCLLYDIVRHLVFLHYIAEAYGQRTHFKQ